MAAGAAASASSIVRLATRCNFRVGFPRFWDSSSQIAHQPPRASCQPFSRSFWAYNSASPVNASGHVEYDYRGQRTLLPLNHIVPNVAVDAWVSPNAVIVGSVEVQDGASVWYGSVLRGDMNKITVGAFSNVQDKCVLHAAESSPTGLSAETTIGKYVTVGAYSIIRSCLIEDSALIGQRCILMEGSLVEMHAILESGSVVPPGRRIPAGEMWAGNPARFVRQVTADEAASITKLAELMRVVARDHSSEFLPYTTAYLEAEKIKRSLLFRA
eukprot:c12226_g1_i1 orf=127-939(+)